jgi:hypothetical protein
LGFAFCGVALAEIRGIAEGGHPLSDENLKSQIVTSSWTGQI